MSPLPSSASAPFWSRIVRLSTLDATRNAIRLGKLALMRPVMTFTDGRWVARMRWSPTARAFCASRASGVSTSACTVIIRSASSSTTTTMSGSLPSVYASDLGRRGGVSGASAAMSVERRRVARRVPERLALQHLAVEVAHVARAVGLEQGVAALHLADRPLEHPRGLLVVGDDRMPEMGQVLVHRQLDHLRVDHQEPQVLLVLIVVDQRRDDRVDADRLAGAGRAGDEEVRHLGQVGDDRPALEIEARAPPAAAAPRLTTGRPPAARAARTTRDLGLGTSTPTMSRPGIRATRIERALILSARSSARLTSRFILTPGPEPHAVLSHDRPGGPPRDVALDLEFGQRLLQPLLQHVELALARHRCLASAALRAARRPTPDRDPCRPAARLASGFLPALVLVALPSALGASLRLHPAPWPLAARPPAPASSLAGSCAWARPSRSRPWPPPGRARPAGARAAAADARRTSPA